MLQRFFEAPAYGLEPETKKQWLVEELRELTDRHVSSCGEYARMVKALFPSYGAAPPASIDDIPFVPVGLFKSHRLVSIPESEIFRTLVSSGTTGQQPSRIFLDRTTAELQTKALASIMAHVLGPQRLPMLIADSESILRGEKRFSARAVGILGMMSFGRNHTYILDDDLKLRRDRVAEFLAQVSGKPFLIFGFTFLVWQALYDQCKPGEFDLSNGILIHSGGWKKLQDRAVSPEEFRHRLDAHVGLKRNYNFYGMVEQVGGVYLEGDDGLLYASNFSEVLIRDPNTLEVLPDGEKGAVQVLSVLPRSYPGHSILTEDLGVIVHRGSRAGGRLGTAFRILGRIPRAEVRGCSDTAA